MENQIKEIEKFLKHYQAVYTDSLYLEGELLKPEVDSASAPVSVVQQAKAVQAAAQTMKRQTTRRKADKHLPVYEGELQKFYEQINDCRKCPLSESRINMVFGAGNSNADILFVGEAPGKDEDEQGIPFVGKSGQLLNKMLRAIKLNREEIFIANILKCRPPKNRDPLPEEVVQCEPHLIRQIELIKPKVIVALGRVAGNVLLKLKDVSLKNLRNETHQYNDLPLIVTYHPSALLRNPNWKKDSWQDLKKIKDIII